jgi:hypothetical protein
MIFSWNSGALAEAHDFSGWDALLKKYLTPATIAGVNLNALAYGKLKDDPQFKALVDGLRDASPGKSKAEKFSFWINIYNILAVKVVADHYPVKSIKDAGSLLRPVWKQTAGVVAGKEITLHEIEHGILRKMNDPRVHTAIVCASVSCPNLRAEAYVPERLETQLDEQMKAFVGNPGKGMRIDKTNQKIHLSAIFKWFEGDFEGSGGVLKFISKYLSPADQQILSDKTFKISYLDYNWDLNGF